MATLANNSSGNFNTAATWSLVDPTSFSNSEAGSTVIGTAFTSSVAFTPGAITIDGIGLKILQTSTVFTGTFTVRLAQAGIAVAGTTVTINVADLPLNTGVCNGFVFFKFAAPVTLAAATAYTVQPACSIASQVTCYRTATATDWSRYLRTTTNQAPAVTDNLLINGEYTGIGTSSSFTVTMDNTAATAFGYMEIGAKGTLTYGTSASTAYQLRITGDLLVNGAATLNIGTSGTPIPVTSSAALEFIVTSNVQFGLNVRGSGSLSTYGATKTGRAYLNADASAAATSLTSNISTGWSSGDLVAVASTANVIAQSEVVTMSGNASGTTIPISALVNAHSGTTSFQAELANLTRNVKIFGQSTTLQSYVFINALANASCNYTELYFLGSGTGSKRGVDIQSTTGIVSFTGCALRNFEVTSSIGMQITATGSVTITDCVFFRINAISVLVSAATTTSVSVSNCWSILNVLAGNNLFQTSAIGGSFTNCTGVSATGFGMSISAVGVDSPNFVCSGFVGHSNNSGAMSVACKSLTENYVNITSTTAWRNVQNGISINGASRVKIDTALLYANTTSNINFLTTFSGDILLRNITSFGGLSPVCPEGIRFTTSVNQIMVENSTFGVIIAHTIGDINVQTAKIWVGASFRNCQFSSTTTVNNATNLMYDSYIASSRHNQIANSFRTYQHTGLITKDNVIFDSSNIGLSASTRLTPSTAAGEKLKTSVKEVIVPSGRALKFSVSVRESVAGDGAAYNGAFPRLIICKNNALGITTDTILATASVASFGAFEIIFGTTPIATDNGVLCVVVDCDGTTGWVNADSWKVEVI